MAKRLLFIPVLLLLLSAAWFDLSHGQALAQVTNPSDGAIGLSGTIPADPPKVGATISFPRTGQTFTEVPIDVTGICPQGLLVKLFKNEVFAGSTQCQNGSFTITTDLFSGRNVLVARVYDELDQAGPDSNEVTVTYNDRLGISGAHRQILITTNFAKRGANPGEELRWPIAISGGRGPYALSVDWGDGTVDLISRPAAGALTIAHKYAKPGVYRVIIKASDREKNSGFLQVVAVANGPLTSENAQDPAEGESRIIIQTPIWPLIVLMVLVVLAFLVGQRAERKRILHKIQSDEPL